MKKLSIGTLLSFFILSSIILETQSARCCLEYRRTPVRCAKLKGYIIQNATNRCDISAIIFKTMSGRFFCADPRMTWTQDRIVCLKEKAARMKLTV
ncbi:C-C motif chemokine 20b [Hoplias malabaricus]|uniref:C-C motif chemokine 20b n=1 Tax=Hoplias malabaricus TaxID=27720 RepID=UPI00346245FA